VPKIEKVDEQEIALSPTTCNYYLQLNYNVSTCHYWTSIS